MEKLCLHGWTGRELAMNKQSLLAERDRLVKEYEPSSYDSSEAAYDGFRAGFDACLNIVLERERVLREALKFYANKDNWEYTDCGGQFSWVW